MGDEWVPPGLGSTVVFTVIVLAVVAMIVGGMASAGRQLGDAPSRARRWTLGTLGFFVVWLVATGGYVASGVADAGGPALMAFFAVSNLLAIALSLSPVGRRLMVLPVAWLIAPHALRLVLELVLHAWADGGTIPVQMSFEGHNFDIVTGVFALGLFAYGLRRPLPVASVWAFNVTGTLLLLGVMGIALLSSPLPFRRYEGAPLLLAFHLPYAWILPMCVSPALFGHVLLFRWLLDYPRRREGRPPHDPSLVDRHRGRGPGG